MRCQQNQLMQYYVLFHFSFAETLLRVMKFSWLTPVTARDPQRALCPQPVEAVERMVDGGTAIQSKSTTVISVGVVYFYITSVHP